jgi:MFS superfamily sulfate permease-like transporter
MTSIASQNKKEKTYPKTYLSSDLIEGIVLCGQSLPVGDSFSSSASNLSSHVCVFCDKILTVAYVSASKKFKNGTQESNDDDEGHAGKI